MKKVLSIFLAIIMALGLSGCCGLFSLDNNDSTSDYEFVGDLDMTVEYNTYLGYCVDIKGKLKNTSGKQFSYVSVSFAIYDQSGNQIDTALDNMNYLQSGSTWSFNATNYGCETRPKSCKLVDVSAW